MNILVSDYDRTFYVNDLDMEKNKEAIERFRKEGNLFVIATGRSFLDLMRKKDLYHFSYDYVILNHGATILSGVDQELNHVFIEEKIINELKKDLSLEHAVNTFCCSGLESRVDFSKKKLTKIHVMYKTQELACSIENQIKEKYKDFVHAYLVSSNTLEIISNKIDKAVAIRKLMEVEKLKDVSIVTVGDGYSDIEMIKQFSGYAMINAVDELKQVAISEVDSVCQLVEKLLKEE